MPDKIVSNNKTYLIYEFTSPAEGFVDLQNTKDMFLEAKDKPFVIIDFSFEGEGSSYLYPDWSGHRGSGLGEQGFWNQSVSSLVIEQLHLLLREYDVDKTILLYGDVNIEENYTKWCDLNKEDRVFGKCLYRPHTLLQRSLDHYNEYNMKPNNVFKSKHFICMNGYSKPHRLLILEKIFENEWQDHGYISHLNTREILTEDYGNIYFHSRNLYLDFDSNEISVGNNQLLLPSQYNDACFDIVTESQVDDASLFITEKTWKPILNKTPFIILGTKNSHKHLEEYFGIKPYTDLFDYSHDGLDYPERIYRLIDNNLRRLLSMDIQELNEIVNSDKMQELMEYNKAQLLKHDITLGSYKGIEKVLNDRTTP